MAKKQTNNNYFTSETDKYIVEYNNTEDPALRSKIFEEHLYYPFYKLAENIIHTFKFEYTDVDDVEDLKHEIISVIIEEKINKFDPSLGAKAYSYFGTIVKRWLINYTRKNYRKLTQETSFDNVEESYEEEVELDQHKGIPLSTFIDRYVDDMYSRIEELFPKEGERLIADAILNVFRSRYELDIFKKKALYIYIREMTECETPHLTKVVAKLKEEFYTKYKKVSSIGLISNRNT